jgi:hypothetical protein
MRTLASISPARQPPSVFIDYQVCAIVLKNTSLWGNKRHSYVAEGKKGVICRTQAWIKILPARH